MTSDVKKHATIFAKYQRRLYHYVDQARDAQRVRVGSGQDATPDIMRARNEQDTVYATIKGNKPADGLILIETAQERSIRKACESLAAHLIERIQNTFLAYDGGGVQGHAHLDAEKLVIDLDGEIPNDVKDIALNLLRSPPQLLRAITTYTARIVNLINRETEKIDVRTDAERLRVITRTLTFSAAFSAFTNKALFLGGSTFRDISGHFWTTSSPDIWTQKKHNYATTRRIESKKYASPTTHKSPMVFSMPSFTMHLPLTIYKSPWQRFITASSGLRCLQQLLIQLQIWNDKNNAL